MLAYLRNESGADTVVDVLSNPSNRCFAHSLNLCEVFYGIHRGSGLVDALAALRVLARVGIVEQADMDAEFWQFAGVIKSVHRRVSLADCCALALEQRLNGTLLTSDRHEFGFLSGKGICDIQFIR